MSAATVALIPSCATMCSGYRLKRWTAYLTDDEPAELAFYRPVCATEEFCQA